MGLNDAAGKDILTEEELAALEDDEGGTNPGEAAPPEGDADAGDDNATADATDAAGDDTDADTDADAGADASTDTTTDTIADATNADAGDQPADTSAAAAAAADTDTSAVEDITSKLPPATWVLPANHAGKIDEVNKQLDDLFEKFDNGELTGKEYRQEERRLTEMRDELKQQKMSADVRRDTAVEGWHTACDEFLAANPLYASAGPLRSMLDTEVRRIQAECAAKGVSDVHPSILLTAANNVRNSAAQLLGVAIEKPKTAEKPAAAAQKPAAKQQQAPAAKKPEPVPTLSNVPVSDGDAIETGEFAWLDRLSSSDPLRYERELQKMQQTNPDKYESYLANIT